MTVPGLDGLIAGNRRDSIADAVRRAALRFRERPAILYGERRWSYRALDAGVGRVAHRLAAMGLQPGERVAAFAGNSDAYLIFWLAAVRAGLVHVPVNSHLSAAELAYILAQSGAAALFHDPAGARIADAGVGALPAPAQIRVTGLLQPDGSAETSILEIAEDPTAPALERSLAGDEDLAQLLYTSGTTAQPKGAMMTHRALLLEYASCLIDLEHREGDRALAALPLYHAAQLHAATMPQLLVGATTRLIEAPLPERVLALIEAERLTSFFAPPTVCVALLRHPDFDRRDLSSLSKLYYGASIMPLPVLEELRRRLPGLGLYQAYGQSEIGPVATALKPHEHDERPASAGRPVLNVETRIVDPEMHDVAPGEPGEIVHRSPQLLIGYWNKPEETAAAFAGGWFHSGDIGTMDEAGYITILDRIKDVINTGGVLVSSREVEEALFTHPSIYEVAVVALSDPKWVEAIAAIVVLRPGLSAEAAEIVAHARERLAPFKVPKRVIFAETLPRTATGKILKRELRRLYDDR